MNGSVSIRGDIITASAPLPRLAGAVPLEGRRVALVFRDGEAKTVDLMPALASRRIYIPLRHDDALFATLRVSDYGDAIEWNVGEGKPALDFSALWLARLPAANFGNTDFRDAMDRLGMSLDGMAAQLGISRRLVADYRKNTPVPNHIALAMRYLVERVAG